MTIYGAQQLTQRSAQGRTQHAVAMLHAAASPPPLYHPQHKSGGCPPVTVNTTPHNKDRISLVNNQHIMTSSWFKQWWYELTTSSHSSSPHPLIPSSPHLLISSSPHPFIPLSPHHISSHYLPPPYHHKQFSTHNNTLHSQAWQM